MPFSRWKERRRKKLENRGDWLMIHSIFSNPRVELLLSVYIIYIYIKDNSRRVLCRNSRILFLLKIKYRITSFEPIYKVSLCKIIRANDCHPKDRIQFVYTYPSRSTYIYIYIWKRSYFHNSRNNITFIPNEHLTKNSPQLRLTQPRTPSNSSKNNGDKETRFLACQEPRRFNYKRWHDSVRGALFLLYSTRDSGALPPPRG